VEHLSQARIPADELMALVARYDGRAPRYTSYPTAVQFSPAVTAAFPGSGGRVSARRRRRIMHMNEVFRQHSPMLGSSAGRSEVRYPAWSQGRLSTLNRHSEGPLSGKHPASAFDQSGLSLSKLLPTRWSRQEPYFSLILARSSAESIHSSLKPHDAHT